MDADSDQNQLSHAKRCEDVWFEDGNLIISVQDILFRVYRGILVSQSSVFRDMFTVPQPPDSEGAEYLDGCPVIVLYDSPEDMTHFLRTLHDSSYYLEHSERSFQFMAAVLRLSIKYDVPHFGNRIRNRFKAFFPTTLSEWHDRGLSNSFIEFSGGAIACIKLFREIDLHSTMPSALFFCATYPISVLVDGSTRDGTHYDLDWDMKSRCLKARPEIIAKYRELLPDLRSDRCPEEKRINCLAARAELISVELLYPCSYGSSLHLLRPWEKTSFSQNKYELCAECQAVFQQEYTQGLSSLWDEIPYYLGYESWEAVQTSEFNDS